MLPFSQPLATTLLLSVFMNLTTGTLYEWNHTVFDLL